jgi:hypothetical protein
MGISRTELAPPSSPPLPPPPQPNPILTQPQLYTSATSSTDLTPARPKRVTIALSLRTACVVSTGGMRHTAPPPGPPITPFRLAR